MSPPAAPVASNLRWYLGGVATWFTAAGAQMILVPWLTTIVLQETPERVGIAQTCAMLPGMLLMLVGGVVADRSDCRRVLVRLHLLNGFPPLVLAWAIAAGQLGYAGLLCYVLVVGIFSPFAMPARDSLLTRVAGSDIQRGVTATMGIQNVSQLGGVAVGGLAAYTGAPAVLLVQAAILFAGAFAASRLPPAPPRGTGAAGLLGAVADIREGLDVVRRSRRLLPVTLLAMCIGLFFMGTFMVAMPLLVRDVYGGSSPEIAGLNGAMMLGMLAAIGGLLTRGGVRRQGLALLVSLAVGSAVLATVSLQLPLAGLYAVIFVWGGCGGVAMTSSRTLVQEAAPETHRARILSVYQLGFTAAAPFGALGMGFAVERVGPLDAVLWAAVGMACAIALVAAVTDVHRLTGARTDAGPAEPLAVPAREA